MDCGIPFCHTGCPVNNIIPDWNDLVYRNRWREALEVLHSTNNFPEMTGRVCPAPCEEACTLNIDDAPVAIKDIEYAIVERAWARRAGSFPKPPSPHRQARCRGRVGPGRAWPPRSNWRAPAMQVTVFEKNAKTGGLLRYGIPDFKLDKADRSIAASPRCAAEGVEFRTNVHVGVTMPAGRSAAATSTP